MQKRIRFMGQGLPTEMVGAPICTGGSVEAAGCRAPFEDSSICPAERQPAGRRAGDHQPDRDPLAFPFALARGAAGVTGASET